MAERPSGAADPGPIADADRAWFDANRNRLATAYLAATDPRAQSGFRGDAARWRRGRGVFAEAIHRDGAFLDVGSANGLLLETLVEWAAQRGHRLDPYGLDISPALVELARRRLPRWADRFSVGNALTWAPPRRFDFVRTELVYVPDHYQRAYVARLLDRFLAPGGRLIVGSYGSATRPEPRAEDMAARLAAWDFDVAGAAAAADLNGVVITRIAWVDRP